MLLAAARPTATTTLPDGTLTLPDGPDAVRETLKLMRDLVREFRTNDTIRQLAAELVQDLPSKAYRSEIHALYCFVAENVRYLQDPHSVEWVQTPLQTLAAESGDCDDQCTLLACMLESIGHPARFIACGFVPEQEQYSHVFCETMLRARGGAPTWLALDPTEPQQPFGWRPPNPAFVMVMST